MALALIHHLVIAAGIPLERVISMLAQNTNQLIIEFVPKQDSQVQRMLAFRQDIFSDYCLESFEKILQKYFTVIDRKPIPGTDRIRYFAERIK